MADIKFRDLKAEEIECRVGSISKKCLSILLYKDARCDMAILDETVGTANWQRKHEEHKGNLFCSVLINKNFDDETKPSVWVSKEDCGTESYTEKEKGEASDSFKRACVNWGIGRELYTSPDIKFFEGDFNYREKNGKAACYDKIVVQSIQIENKKIVGLEVLNKDTKKVYVFGKYDNNSKKSTAAKKEAQASSDSDADFHICADCGNSLTDAEANWSSEHFPTGYCRNCQKNHRNEFVAKK